MSDPDTEGSSEAEFDTGSESDREELTVIELDTEGNTESELDGRTESE